MFEKIISFILMNFPSVMSILALVIASLNPFNFNRRLYACMLLFSIGITGVWAFIMHAFFSSIASQNIGWQASPFEFEVALANLAFGVSGLVAFFANWSYRAAVSIAYSIFLWGAAASHIYQIITTHNMQAGNAGSILWADILIPIILIILMILTYKTRRDDLIYYE